MNEYEKLDLAINFLNENVDLRINRNYKNPEINGIRSEIIRKNGTDYIIKVPEDIRKEAEHALKIAKEYINECTRSKEFKDLIKDLGIKVNLLDDIRKEVYSRSGNKYVLCVIISSSISQDDFYKEASNGKHIFDYTDAAFKKFEKDSRLKKLPHLDGVYNGDDFFGWDINFDLGDNVEDLMVELK